MAFRFGTQRSLGLPIGGAVAILKPQDVFATSLYTGNNTGQTINNGLDLAGKGGFVWMKSRGQSYSHQIYSTGRGIGKRLSSDTTAAEATAPGGAGLTSFNANGFTLGSNIAQENDNGATMVAWAGAYAPKFCVEVTWTGDGTSNRQIPHGLGVVPGMVVVFTRNFSGNDRIVYHRSVGATGLLRLNTTASTLINSTMWNNTEPTASVLTIGSLYNDSALTYVAYLFAHDPSADGIVQCGSYVASSNAVINLGWRPQFLLAKTSDVGGPWLLFDSTRGFDSTSYKYLYANQSNAEASFSGDFGGFTATGFIDKGYVGNAGNSVIYLAIRAPY